LLRFAPTPNLNINCFNLLTIIIKLGVGVRLKSIKFRYENLYSVGLNMKKEIKIIPAINENSFNEIERKLNLVSPFSDWVHLDIADGSFTPNILWNEPERLEDIETEIKIEVHLMVLNPEYVFEKWLGKNTARIIFNLETINNFDFLATALAKHGVEIGLSITPNTSYTTLKPYLDKIDLAQILAVSPGMSGQKFEENSLEKISALRTICSNCVIEIDGGINSETAKNAILAGADILVSSSYVWSGGNIEERIKSLKKFY